MVSLPVNPQKLKLDLRAPFELSSSEIGSIIETGQQIKGDILSYRIAWHMKFAYPLAAFLISFLGLRFGYQSERTSETIRGLFLALILALSYWFILSASKALCSSGNLHPFFAGWLANAWVALVVFWQFWHLDRRKKS
jgi:lipopolysaccharide export system permease protein